MDADDIYYRTETVFAWLPVRLTGGGWVWLTKVRRQSLLPGPGLVLGKLIRYKPV